MDFRMKDGSIRCRFRAAVAGFMLLCWSMAYSAENSIKKEQYRLWLSDPLALCGVENARLAPGYQAPSATASRKV
jgi:hypothetical protein